MPHPTARPPARPQICSVPCKADSPQCQPLSSFQLRMSDALLRNASLAVAAVPLGRAVTECDPRGPGYLWEGPALKTLGTTKPSEVRGGT